MATSGFDTCYCGHPLKSHGAQNCIGKMADQQSGAIVQCDCQLFIPVLAAIAQSLNSLVTHVVDLKHVIATAAGLRESPKKLFIPR